MQYCSRQDMITRFSEVEIIQLTDIDGTGIINDTVLNSAIDDASAEIDGYLAQYNLPLATVPLVLTRKCADITRYFLYDDMSPELVSNNYKAAIAFLINVSKGVVSLGVDTGGSVIVADNSASFLSDSAVFGRKGY